MGGPATDGPGSDSPRHIQSLAVHTDDLIDALESRLAHDRPVVLRITPPFAARERARIHLAGGEGEYGQADEPEPVHLSPLAFLDEERPDYPTVDGTEDRLRDRGEYSVERHRERHEQRVAAWREAVRDHRLAEVAIETEAGTQTVDVRYLG